MGREEKSGGEDGGGGGVWEGAGRWVRSVFNSRVTASRTESEPADQRVPYICMQCMVVSTYTCTWHMCPACFWNDIVRMEF